MAQKDIGKDKPQKDQKVIPLFGDSNKGKPAPTKKKAEAQHPSPSRSDTSTAEQKVGKKTDETINKETTDNPRIATADQHEDSPSTASDKGMSFSDIMKRNAENRDRLRKERLKANQKVIRTHRLKH